MIKNNLLNMQPQGPEDTGFVLVHGQEKNFGRIILCNQVLRRSLGYSSKDLKHMNIVDFMPTPIKKWHGGFVNVFSKSGGASTAMLNRTNCVFIKKKTGYIVPAMVHIRFHYSKDYDFTFVCFVSFMSQIQIQKTVGTGRHKVENILFFICDDVDGSVTDISESCSK